MTLLLSQVSGGKEVPSAEARELAQLAFKQVFSGRHGIIGSMGLIVLDLSR